MRILSLHSRIARTLGVLPAFCALVAAVCIAPEIARSSACPGDQDIYHGAFALGLYYGFLICILAGLNVLAFVRLFHKDNKG
jgi:hypothetical protein